jgi:RNA polymerase sigma-70 factor (ECF subfamily)
MARLSLALDESIAEETTHVTDNARLERMIGDHLDFVWRLLQHVGVPEAELDDAAQQVFMVASRKLADIGAADERTFLYGTALRVASTVRRAGRRRREVGGVDLTNLQQTTRTAEDLVDQSRARALLDTLLQQMPEELRTIYVLAEIEEFPVPEIARMQGLPVGTATSRLRRAREDFRARLTRWKAQHAVKGAL